MAPERTEAQAWGLSVPRPTVQVVHHSLRTRRPSRPTTSTEVNAQIRRLMDRPSGDERAQEYIRLLALWAEAAAARTDWDTAA